MLDGLNVHCRATADDDKGVFASVAAGRHIHARTCMMISLTTIFASEAVKILE